MTSFLFILFSSMGFAAWEPMSMGWSQNPGACQCEGAIKDYSAEKGYYFDRVSGSRFSKIISGRFECSYSCRDSRGDFWRVSYIHEETHRGGKSAGAKNAKRFICSQSIDRFVPHRDMMGNLLYYDAIPRGPFDALSAERPEIREWATNFCSTH